MSGVDRTIVSWTRFCEWVQGKKVRAESYANYYSVIDFEDGTQAVFYSKTDLRFGETVARHPMVEIVEPWKETP